MPTFGARRISSGDSPIARHTIVCSDCGDIPTEQERSQADMWREHLEQVHDVPAPLALAHVQGLVAEAAHKRAAHEHPRKCCDSCPRPW